MSKCQASPMYQTVQTSAEVFQEKVSFIEICISKNLLWHKEMNKQEVETDSKRSIRAGEALREGE